jgi:heptosyltransferase II
MRLLVRLPNWVGDACMALPALRALADAGAALQLAGKGWAGDLLAGHGWPVLRLVGRLRADAAAIRATGIRDGLLLTNSLSSAAALRFGGVSALGHANEGRSPLLGHAIGRPVTGHEVEAFWRLAREWARWRGLPALAADPPPRLGLLSAASHVVQADQALVRGGIAGARFVALAPLATGSVGGRSKVWPDFARLCRTLADRGIRTVCCPGPGEEAAAMAAVPHAVHLHGLGLGAYAAVCRRAALVVANDSGPMHLAAAVDAPVLGVFGVGDPGRTRPWGPAARWVGAADRWPSLDRVLEAIDELLQAPRDDRPQSPRPG